MRPATLFAAIVCALVAASVVVAFVAIGTPMDARRAALDMKRERDLAMIAGTLRDRYTRRKLPMRLSDAFVGGTALPTDPETQQPYAYRRIDAAHYRLCAVFAAPTDERGAARSFPNTIAWPPRGSGGTTCYELDIRDAPPYPQRVPAR